MVRIVAEQRNHDQDHTRHGEVHLSYISIAQKTGLHATITDEVDTAPDITGYTEAGNPRDAESSQTRSAANAEGLLPLPLIQPNSAHIVLTR